MGRSASHDKSVVLGIPVTTEPPMGEPPVKPLQDDSVSVCENLRLIVRSVTGSLVRTFGCDRASDDDGEPLLQDEWQKEPAPQPHWSGTPLLPPVAEGDRGKLCVVLDLDETIVQNRLGPGLLVERPHLREFLAALKDRCELVLWTASRPDVAAPAVSRIDSDGTCFRHVIYRDERWFQGEDMPYTKDLRLLGRERTVVVENTVGCVRYNPELAIMVDDFWGVSPESKTDGCLLKVLRVLNSLIANPMAEVADVVGTSQVLSPRRAIDGATGRTLALHYITRQGSAGGSDSIDDLML